MKLLHISAQFSDVYNLSVKNLGSNYLIGVVTMTEENFKYRTSPFLLRNQFIGDGKLKIPIVPKFQEREDDFTDLKLIGFDKSKLEGNSYLDRMVHFFLYDYKFERVWKNPDLDLEKLKRYRAVLTPDFSMYTEMAPVLQIYNTFRNRWCGAYYASEGIRVIPTVSWGNEDSFDFCFEGIEKGSTVAVSTYMVSEHENHKDQKDFFLKGYSEMLRRIEPERIICYNEPFPEMQGNLVFVDYDLSSWRYMNDNPHVPSKYVKYINNVKPCPVDYKVIRKTGYILPEQFIDKGMGSANGGEWKPSKEDDERFLGEPGEVKISRAATKNGGYLRETKIGDDGKAIVDRHWTDHDRPWAHSDPHDHSIDWSGGYPNLSSPINYPDGIIPEFKNFKEIKAMSNIDNKNSSEVNRFKTISEFKWCVNHGGEVEFVYNEKFFGIAHDPDAIAIYEANKQETEKLYKDADEALEFMIDGVRLRDIITEVEVTDRTI
ncbi:MAG: DUF4417 domain-containing protein [Bacillota bacterium]|nr:DUF4417 domain-containing protein [Bacillota bacterium]